MSTLRFPQPEERPASLDELLSLLDLDKIDVIDQKVRMMRESFQCPYTVPDYNGFLRIAYDYFAHYQKTFYGVDIKVANVHQSVPDYWKDLAIDFLKQHLGSYQGDLRTAERNAITGRDGGMIAVTDTITESLTKLHTKTYVERIFQERIAHSDFITRFQLGKELVKKYGQFLPEGDEILPYEYFAINIEASIQAYANYINAMRRNARR